MPEITIRPARSDEDYAAFTALSRAYVDWCRVRYADMAWWVDWVFGFQDFAAEQADARAKYGPPAGIVMVAELAGTIVGSGVCWRFAGDIGELKRIYVADSGRGHGIGRRLTEALVAAGRDAGYRAIRLDTACRHDEALALYESLGFVRIAPYQPYPEHVLPYSVFMERVF